MNNQAKSFLSQMYK